MSWAPRYQETLGADGKACADRTADVPAAGSRVHAGTAARAWCAHSRVERGVGSERNVLEGWLSYLRSSSPTGLAVGLDPELPALP